MQKIERKTAEELETMIEVRLGRPINVKVMKDQAYGWQATLLMDRRAALDLQSRVEQIATDLRANYDLKE